MTNSAKKSAIVTGASGGIGSSIAKRLAKDGFSVVVNYAGKPAPAQAVVADLKAAGGQGIAVQADVANAEDVERARFRKPSRRLSMRRSANDRFECISIQRRTEPRWCSG